MTTTPMLPTLAPLPSIPSSSSGRSSNSSSNSNEPSRLESLLAAADDHDFYGDDGVSWFGMTMYTAALSLTGFAAYQVYQLVDRYGWEGAFNYIWEGDAYPHIRQYLTALDSLTKALSQQEETIQNLQEALQRAQLDCVDDDSTGKAGSETAADATSTVPDARLIELWQQNMAKIMKKRNKKNKKVDLKSILAGLSYQLDTLAAKIDAVPSAANDPMVKSKKKKLSGRVVELFQQADALIAVHQKAEEAAKKS